jgi:hypothetical protein
MEPSIFSAESSSYRKNGRRFMASYPSHTVVPMPSLSPVSFMLATSFYVNVDAYYPGIISSSSS